jgi:hypothetical protein
MANAWITQFRSAAVINGVSLDVPLGPALRTQKIAFTGTAAASAAIGSDCGLVGIYVDATATWVAGAAPVATESDTPISAGVMFFFVPTGLHKISFVAGAATGQFTPQLFLLLMGA